MAAAKSENLQNFINANGYLRVIILVVGFTQLGLILGSYGGSVPEAYQLVVVSVFLAVTIGSVVLYVADATGTSTETYKVMDYSLHLYGTWFLVNSSLAKFLVAKRLGGTDEDTAVQFMSVILGLANAGVYGWLAHVTSANANGLPCLKSAEVGDAENIANNGNLDRSKKMKSKTLFKSSDKMNATWSWDRCCTWEKITKRVEWTTIFDGGSNHMRIFTLLMGLVTVILIAQTYDYGRIYEEYFLGVACFNIVVTLIMHDLYLLGVSECFSPSVKIFDYSFHLSHGIFLASGATLALSNPSSRDMIIASVLGICNGILYLIIGMNYKQMPALQQSIQQEANEDDEEFTAAMNALNNRNAGKRDGRDKISGHVAPAIPRHMRTSIIFDPSKM